MQFHQFSITLILLNIWLKCKKCENKKFAGNIDEYFREDHIAITINKTIDLYSHRFESVYSNRPIVKEIHLRGQTWQNLDFLAIQRLTQASGLVGELEGSSVLNRS